MPRRKAADRTGPVKTRSRSGCRECRAGRVRCDTKKPVCTRCLEKGLPCSTDLVLKWESEFASRGVAFGRAGVWKSQSSASATPSPAADDDRKWCPLPMIHPWGFVNSGVAAFKDPQQPEVSLNESNALVSCFKPFPSNALGDQLQHWLKVHPAFKPAALVAFSNQSPSPPIPLFPGLVQLGQGELFDYYLQQVCPRTTASPSASSPFASAILPFSRSASPALFKAIQALGACHLSRTNPLYDAIGLRLKSETLRDLRRRLSVEGPLTCSNDPEVLVIMMMLCLYEIVDKCDQRWTIHLKGAKDLIRLRRQHAASPPQSSEVTVFAEQFFAFQDIIGRTACAQQPLFGSDYWKADDRHIDLWMGCSPELVNILSKITDMSRERRSLDSSEARASYALRAASVERQLEHLVQEVEGGDDEILASAAAAKRMAAMLYLHCAIYRSNPTSPLVVDYVRKILDLTSDLLDHGSSIPNLTWPVFVAAVELDPSQDELWSDANSDAVSGRALVLRALGAMSESTIANIARTRAVIVQVWQARDQALVKAPALGECNDWEWYVVPVSDAMSLA